MPSQLADVGFSFGGTDGQSWFNDVWTYEPRSNAWTELDCIGYIPVPREGHSAALVNDTMYIFGGRTQEGVDLGDLAAFRISSRRWYMFQNMGHSPSARSGHSMTAFGKHIITLAGEPSSSASDRNELSMAYILDTSKIRYPPNETAPPQQAQGAPRKTSGGDRPVPPPLKGPENLMRESMLPGPPGRSPDPLGNGMVAGGSRLPRASQAAPSGPPPLQQPPQPRINGINTQPNANPRSKTPTKNDRAFGPMMDPRAAPTNERPSMERPSMDRPSVDRPSVDRPSMDRDNYASQTRDIPPADAQRSPPEPLSQRAPKESMDTIRSGSSVSRNTSRSHRQQASQESVEQAQMRQSSEAQRQRTASREAERAPMETAPNALPNISPVNNQQIDELTRELEVSKSRNAWYASELTLARKAGYNAGSATSPVFDERSTEAFREEDKPLLEALLRMKTELERVQTSIKSQGEDAAQRIAEVERQRDAAVSEAIYAKAKLAAHGGGSQHGTPQPDGARSIGTPDMDRVQDINRRLAASLSAQAELSTQVEQLTKQMETEKRAKQLADESAEAAQQRVQELDSTRQQTASEVERLRAELHEAERVAREVSTSATEAEASSKLLAVDKRELSARVAQISEESRNHSSILESLREAVLASSEKSTLLEQKLESERVQSDNLRQKLAQLRSEHEAQVTELEIASQKLRDAEEMAEKHAEEARHHQQAVLSGLGNLKDRSIDDNDTADERVTILQQQIESANGMARRNQIAADQASEKLRRAEERIAGLESYQEQSSREGLTIRKQLQQAMRDAQAAEAEKAELRQNHERVRLESNAFEVQLKTLKNLLDERGMNSVDSRRSRALDSPNSRFGTPELNRVRELEQQVDAMNKAHEELRIVFEEREHEVSKEWEEKLQALHNDHQAAVKYLRGTEKMLAKMKQELDRYKNVNSRLEEELNQAKYDIGSMNKEQASAWEAEKLSLRQELENTQDTMKTTVARLESQCAKLQADLASAREETTHAATGARQAESSAAQSRLELETLRRQYAQVEERAREAESRVQMFLDQFESSVDNYRRQSHLPAEALNGVGVQAQPPRHHQQHDSIASVDSMYSHTDDSSTPEGTIRPSSSGTRNSMALDNLASELDALRSHWETTNKAYRLSERYDFEQTPSTDKNELSDSLMQWKSKIEMGSEPSKPGEKRETKPMIHPEQHSAMATNLSSSPPPS